MPIASICSASALLVPGRQGHGRFLDSDCQVHQKDLSLWDPPKSRCVGWGRTGGIGRRVTWALCVCQSRPWELASLSNTPWCLFHKVCTSLLQRVLGRCMSRAGPTGHQNFRSHTLEKVKDIRTYRHFACLFLPPQAHQYCTVTIQGDILRNASPCHLWRLNQRAPFMYL